MAVAQRVLQPVNDLLKRFDVIRGLGVAAHKRGKRHIQHLGQRRAEYGQLPLRFGGEGDLFRAQLLSRFKHIDAVVGNPFKIADGLEQLGHLRAVVFADLIARELGQICA